MKTVKFAVIPLTVFLLLNACSKTKTEPFDAHFTGEYANVLTGDDLKGCDEGFACRVVVNFKGNASQLGEFSGTFNFCACGPNGEYGPTDSYLVSSEGDSLFFSCQGRVVDGRLEDHPEYVISYWKDPFTITGGTGKFEGATGEGMTDDYNSSQDPNSHHHWIGEITLKK